MKKILISTIILLSVLFIYLKNVDKKIYYLSLGDSLALGITPYNTKDYSYQDYVKDYLTKKNLLEFYIDGYNEKDLRITDLINKINDNDVIETNGKKRTIKNSLIKADLITLSIGNDELISKINLATNMDEDEMYDYINGMISDMEELISLIREYCKEDIILIGPYKPRISLVDNVDKIYKFINQKYMEISKTYKIHYIDAYNILNDKDMFNNNSIYPNKLGYIKIGKEIVNIIESKVID